MSQSDPRTSSGEAGYFLTDALVGLFVLASVAGSLLGAFGLARSMSANADHTTKALVIAKSCIEEGTMEERVRKFSIEGVEYNQSRSLEVVKKGEGDVVELVRISCAAQWIERSSSREVRLQRIEASAPQP